MLLRVKANQSPLHIFVSSTGDGLSAERNVANRSIARSGHVPIAMEFFLAHPEPALEVCLDLVAQSDLFIAILGFQYGSIPPGRSISYSEAEYNHARALQIPCLVFMKDPNTRNISFADVESDAEKLKLLTAWMARLWDETTVRTFTSESNFTERFEASLRDRIAEVRAKRRKPRNHLPNASRELSKLQDDRWESVWVYAPEPLEVLAGEDNLRLRWRVGMNIMRGVKYKYFVYNDSQVENIIQMFKSQAKTAQFGANFLQKAEALTEIFILREADFDTYFTVHVDKAGHFEVLQSVLTNTRSRDKLAKLESHPAERAFMNIQSRISAHRPERRDGFTVLRDRSV